MERNLSELNKDNVRFGQIAAVRGNALNGSYVAKSSHDLPPITSSVPELVSSGYLIYCAH